MSNTDNQDSQQDAAKAQCEHPGSEKMVESKLEKTESKVK